MGRYLLAMVDLGKVEIGQLDADEYKHAVASTARAFWPDPLFGFFSRDRLHEHSTMLPAFFAPVLKDSMRHGEVWVARFEGDVIGTAAWLPPGDMPRGPRRDSAIYAGAVRVMPWARNRVLALRLLAEVDRRHPHEEHWYLALLGIDPRWQRRGVGSLVLEPVLRRCDEQGIPAYLETQKPENIIFYGRFGFTVKDEIRLPGAPPVWLLWRDPRPPE
jgi:GNAT superfamily N-acetyltransferase